MAVLQTVQFQRQLCVRAVEIQDVIPDRMLPTEFETGKTPAPQCPPERFFAVRLVTAQLAGDLFEAHEGMMFFDGEISSPPHFYSFSSPNEEKAGVRSLISDARSLRQRPGPDLQGQPEELFDGDSIAACLIHCALFHRGDQLHFNSCRRQTSIRRMTPIGS